MGENSKRDPREEWREIAAAPKYEVSNFGNVRRKLTGAHVKQYTVSGYPRVNLWVGNTKETRRRSGLFVHRCVALAFLGAPTGPEVRHLDGHKLNPQLDNLAYGTRAENEADKRRHGTVAKGARNGQAKLTSDQVRQIRSRIAVGEKNVPLAKEFGVSRWQIGLIRRGKKWANP